LKLKRGTTFSSNWSKRHTYYPVIYRHTKTSIETTVQLQYNGSFESVNDVCDNL